ncbi:MAG TPA: hypothetical protein PK366_04985 [Fibrobacteraceae bacterium]|nr:hypothetical protein [Fibrobacteraceae bacterium]
MAKNIEIGLNVSGIISDYRAAISAMEQAGAKANITSGLTKSLDRLEEKFKNLENEGAFGKESSREIENYRKRVDTTFSSLGALGKELERIKGDKKAFPQVEQLRKDKRIQTFGEADYTNGSHSWMWLSEQVNSIAQKLVLQKEESIRKSSSAPPGHL